MKTQAVVIGGGVIGASIAYHLTKRNIDTILVEKENIASGSSGACDGFVFMQSKKPGIHLKMALESARMMGQLSKELPGNIEYEKKGGMIIIKDEDDMPQMQRLVNEQRKAGIEVHLLDAHDAYNIQPCISKDIAGATYSPLDAQINPMSLCHALADGAMLNGAKVITNTEVTGIDISSKRVRGVNTAHGFIKSDFVVNAAGAWAPTIGKMVGLDIPIKPRRGQVIVTEPVPDILKSVIICSRYITSKYNPRQVQNPLGVGLALEQTNSGGILIGSTREFVGYDRKVTHQGMQAILSHALTFMPAIRELNMIRAFAGLRPYTPDGMPIIEEVKGIEGFIIAAGHEGDGITLSPITGFLVAEFIATGKWPENYRRLTGGS
ncbi:FAD-binding oxidoreductase [Candidatus Poribacteria bacterium]|nr:FAD-binding oxidoreductase [Candidatus Poribacteria bacterium]